MRVSILLVEMPRMLHDVIAEVIGVEPDFRVVADGVQSAEVVETVERERPDVVVLWGESHAPPVMCEELLGRFPGLAVVALEDRGQRGSIYMMRPTRVRVTDISRTQLVSAIRRAAGPLSAPTNVFGLGSSTHTA